MSTPTNTTRLYKENPMVGLMEAMVDNRKKELGLPRNPDGAIGEMESRGQAEFVASTVIPTDLGHGDILNEYVLTALGFTLGEVVEGDPLFRHAELPAGWSKKTTDHAMHSDILDEQGRPRFSIFYKAAFYDRRASMRINCRFELDVYSDDCERADKAVRCLFRTNDDPPVVVAKTGYLMVLDGTEPWGARDALKKKMEEWLEQNYPGFKSPLAYWDVDLSIRETVEIGT